MFSIRWKKKATKELDKLEHSLSQRIIKSIRILKENPFNKDVKKLKGINGYRLRVGDYRVIFDIEGKCIIILKVGHRKNIYK